jgi:hypothetical protein
LVGVTDWRVLRDAFGSAGAVEGLLERGDTDQRDVWDELWSRLCLHEVAERMVRMAGDDTDFVYRVQALIATEEGGVWGSRLDALVDQELEVACPHCGGQLLIGLETSPPEVQAFDDVSVGVTSTISADLATLIGSEARAYQLAMRQGRGSLAEQMLDLFGEFECPTCRVRTQASAAFA